MMKYDMMKYDETRYAKLLLPGTAPGLRLLLALAFGAGLGVLLRVGSLFGGLFAFV